VILRRPKALAAIRLMISSNLVGCLTVRSAGFARAQNLADKIGGAAIEIQKVALNFHPL